jgi:hypothetical protein
MTIKTINAKQIRKISAEGITYTDDDSSEGFIDFEECYQNYLKEKLSSEYLKYFQEINSFSDENMLEEIEHLKAWKEIGQRNILGGSWGYHTDVKTEKPYFLLHQQPPTAIECDDEGEFMRVGGEFAKHGWHTFDIT